MYIQVEKESSVFRVIKGSASKKTFYRTCPLSSVPPSPSSPFAVKQIKSIFFSPFFIHIPIPPECYEMDNFDKKQTGCCRSHQNFKNLYGRLRKHKFTVLTKKNYSGHAK